MKRAGDIALMPFPFTDLANTKKRPVLLISRLTWWVLPGSLNLHTSNTRKQFRSLLC